jgi:hypothetical protein
MGGSTIIYIFFKKKKKRKEEENVGNRRAWDGVCIYESECAFGVDLFIGRQPRNGDY